MAFISPLTFAQIIADGTYKIFSSVHSEVITTDLTAPYEAFMATPNATDNFQLWTFTHQGGDIYKIENEGSSTILGINDGWCGQFGDVRAGFTNTDLNVEFKVSAADVSGTYVFEIAFTTCNFGSTNVPIKAFDIQDGSSGAQIQTFDVDTANPNQQFQIVEPNSLSLEDINSNLRGVKLSYNKANRSLSLNLGTSLTISKIDVFDISGRVITTNENVVSERILLDFNTHTNGIYFVRIANDGKPLIKKFLVY